jgi:hypothetical protein
VARIERKYGAWRVFNLEIGRVHRYYVSLVDVLVHNNCNLAVDEALEKGELREVSPKEAGVESQIHHIATIYGDYGKEFEEMFGDAGMNLEDPLNKIEVPGHQGPHPEIYHQEVLKSLRDAVEGEEPGTLGYRDALRAELSRLHGRVLDPSDLLPFLQG